ncbi:MAG: protein kinase domain-containing protein [Acidobacteriota bacterium]
MGGQPTPEDRTHTAPIGEVDEVELGHALPARWRVARLLGRGGQADVWLAWDAELAEWVAVKVFHRVLSPSARERLRREVRLGRQLQHPNLVKIFELIDATDRLAVVMEWIPEGSVAQKLATSQLPVEEVVRIADEALAALECLHQHQVVHRDVKPSNLLVDTDGRIRLADLGLVRRLDEQRDLTRTALAVGTPLYMSPEQIRGQRGVPASDLYSMGATLYELLTARPPFVAPSELEVAHLHLQERPADVRRARPDCPAWLARFVARLLEKAPEDRFPDAGKAREALRRRRVLFSPRVRRRAAVIAVGTLFAAASLVALGRIALPRLGQKATAQVEAAGTTIRGLDDRGDVTWLLPLAGPVRQVERADLDGDGHLETIVATGITSLDRSRALRSEVVVVRDQGQIVTRRDLATLIPDWPYAYPKTVNGFMKLFDVDGDGHPELVVRCLHLSFFPSAVVIYWPLADRWSPVLINSGHITDVVPVPGSSPPRLRVVGINNRLAMLPIAGEFVVSPPGKLEKDRLADTSWCQSPDFGLSATSASIWSWYTPFDQGRYVCTIAVDGDGGSTIGCEGRTRRVDRFGNPVPGPNAGRDLSRERLALLDRIAALEPASQPITAAGVKGRLEEIQATFPELLAERPYQAMLGIAGGRAFARVGALPEAIALMRRAEQAAPFEDVTYRLAQLEALAGELRTAADRLVPAINSPITSRGNYDDPKLLLRLAVEMRDEHLFTAALPRVGHWGLLSDEALRGLSTALWARAHLYWDELSEADCSARSWAYAPAGDAIGCLARWRLGQTLPTDPDAMRASLERNPDAAAESQVALAAAELGLGRASDALAVIGKLISALEPECRDSFENRQTLDLAEGVYVKALEVAGHHREALERARWLRPSLRDGLLPAKLVDEVLETEAARSGP